MSVQGENLSIALLGMSDNQITRDLIELLDKEGVSLDVVILQTPGLRTNVTRLKRKIVAAGFVETIRRVRFAAIRIIARHFHRQEYGQEKEKNETVLVADPNGDDVKQIIQQRNIDVLLLSTDSIISRGVFSLPKRATLNAHPGQVPEFRGLGGLTVQVSRGITPSMSVHVVNEGIDTGPVLLRRDLPRRILVVDQSERDQMMTEWQARLFAMTLKKIASGDAVIIDTFLEPSSMTRGVSKAFARRAWSGSKDRVDT